MVSSSPTERIQVTGGPWPERIGCQGFIVKSGPSVYPWAGLSKTEVVVLLDDDPLDRSDESRSWSCVLDRTAVIIFA